MHDGLEIISAHRRPDLSIKGIIDKLPSQSKRPVSDQEIYAYAAQHGGRVTVSQKEDNDDADG